MSKKRSFLHYLLISIIFITILSHLAKGAVYSIGVLVLLVLFTGLFCYLSIRKAGLFSQKPFLSAAMSIPFLFFIILAKGVSTINFIIDLRENIWSSLGLLGFGTLILLIVIFFLVKRSYRLFRQPVDIAFIVAVVFILLFSYLTHLAGITPTQQDYSVDYPLFFCLAKVVVIYLAINILLRDGIFIKPLLILQLISLTAMLLIS